ncbi:MAG TPA: DUF3017 domain-containing protein [Jiangellaceae bacterium]|nr:DUF3017 domain-containing protein [Jiangellaceae bacterium]
MHDAKELAVAGEAPPPEPRRTIRERLADVAERRTTPASWLSGLGRQWPLIVVLVVVGAGLLVVAGDDFVLGCLIVAAGLGVAAILRGVLPDRSIGLLCVRNRGLDVFLLTALSVATVVATLIVPPPT